MPSFLRLPQKWTALVSQLKLSEHCSHFPAKASRPPGPQGDNLDADLGSAPRALISLGGTERCCLSKWRQTKNEQHYSGRKLHTASPSSSQRAIAFSDPEAFRHANLSHIQKGITNHTANWSCLQWAASAVSATRKSCCRYCSLSGNWTEHSPHAHCHWSSSETYGSNLVLTQQGYRVSSWKVQRKEVFLTFSHGCDLSSTPDNGWSQNSSAPT